MCAKEGELGKVMYIIETGMVEASVVTNTCQHKCGDEVCKECVLLGRQGPKSFFGELAVMGVQEWQRRKRSVRAKTNCHLSVLAKDVLDDLRFDYPELNEQLFRVASGVKGVAASDSEFHDEHITRVDELAKSKPEYQCKLRLVHSCSALGEMAAVPKTTALGRCSFL